MAAFHRSGHDSDSSGNNVLLGQVGHEVDALPNTNPSKGLEAPKFPRLFKLFKWLAHPYWVRSRTARKDIAIVLVFALLRSGVSVAWSYLARDFYNALNEKNSTKFWRQTALLFGACCAFSPINVYYQYFHDRCALRWRDWITQNVLEQYIANRNFYKIEHDSSNGVDNPDQRIAEDLNSFTYESIVLILAILSTSIDLVSFSVILLTIFAPLFGVLILYALSGSLVIIVVGRKLVSLKYLELVREANLRYSLIRIRDNAESIAFFNGEQAEKATILSRLRAVILNRLSIIGCERNINFMQTAYNYLVSIVPAIFVAPLYFKGKITLGTVLQSFDAFGHVLGDLSIFINRFNSLSHFAAGLERLGQFVTLLERSLATEDRIFTGSVSQNDDGGVFPFPRRPQDIFSLSDESPRTREKIIETIEIESNALVLRDICLITPLGSVPRMLIYDLSIEIDAGARLLVVGPSGAGKSSLLRAIAGLWTHGSGIIERPERNRMVFLPQKPYCTLGTLRSNLLYPHSSATFDAPEDAALMHALNLVDLDQLPSNMGGLDVVRDWSDTLSLGEQQRLQFARLILAKPAIAIIDEGSAALSLEAEAKMYHLLEDMGITVVSVGHRPTLLKYHDFVLRLGKDGSGWNIEETTQVQQDRILDEF